MKPITTPGRGPRFTSADSQSYHQSGAFLAKGLVDAAGVALLQQASNEDFRPEDHSPHFAPEFDRYSNQFVSRTRRLKGLLDALSGPLSELVQRDIVFTQGIVFELRTGTRGYRWHFDNLSFCFIRPEDLAFTLWVPLTPIRVKEQNGGILLVDRRDFCARSRMQQWAYHERRRDADEDLGRRLAVGKQAQYEDRWYGAYDLEMLEDLGQERDMDVGDALIFDRFTWHRSQRLAPGPIETRTTVAFRAVDADARFDKALFEQSMEHRTDDDVPPLFGHLLLELEDGVPMREAAERGISLWGKVAGQE